MVTTLAAKAAESTSAVPVKIMPKDPENLHLSRAQFEEKYRKQTEKEKRLKLAEAEIEAKMAAEEKEAADKAAAEALALEQVGSQDNKQTQEP